MVPRITVTLFGVPQGSGQSAGGPAVAVAKQAKNLRPFMAKVPRIVRIGPGSLQQQIQARAFFDFAGGRRAWKEPSYASGKARVGRAAALEDIMWRAVLGTGPGSITRTSTRLASVGVNDAVIRAVSGARGNKVTPTEPYFPFVTGNFSERTAPANARWTKRTRPGGGSRGGTPRQLGSDFYAKVSGFNVRLAAWWFIGLTYGRWLSESDMRSGLPIPPKNMGWNPVLLKRVESAVLDHLLGPANDRQRGAA